MLTTTTTNLPPHPREKNHVKSQSKMHSSENQAIDMPVIAVNGQSQPHAPERVQTTQPRASAPMGMSCPLGMCLSSPREFLLILLRISRPSTTSRPRRFDEPERRRAEFLLPRPILFHYPVSPPLRLLHYLSGDEPRHLHVWYTGAWERATLD